MEVVFDAEAVVEEGTAGLVLVLTAAFEVAEPDVVGAADPEGVDDEAGGRTDVPLVVAEEAAGGGRTPAPCAETGRAGGGRVAFPVAPPGLTA